MHSELLGGSAWWEEFKFTFPEALVLARSPVDELNDSIKNGRWFEGLVLVTSYYEILAVEQINSFLKSQGKEIDSERFGRLGFERLLIFLYSHDIIDKKDYDQLIQLNTYRNRVVHHLVNKKIDIARAEMEIRHGIECWKRLFAKKI